MPVPILFERFFPVKNFHTFSVRKKILASLAQFLLRIANRPQEILLI